MDIAIIGLPQSGKSTVFKALTGGHFTTTGAGGAGPVHVGVVKVLDSRLAVLTEIYSPRKTVPAEIQFWDLPLIDREPNNQLLGGRQRNLLQGADAMLLVVQTFDDPDIPHPSGSVDPARDLQLLLAELTLADLETLEKSEVRLSEGLKKAKPAERPALVPRLDVVRKVKETVEMGTPVRQQTLTNSEASALSDFQLLTSKSVVVAFNTGESGPSATLAGLGLPSDATAGLGEVALSAKLEEDLALMAEEEAAEFREALGLEEPAIERVKSVCYDTVGLISFLTVGEDEVRAWPVLDGILAQDAAGTIHSDFFRGFIRAEVIRYDDLVRCGSVAQGRKEGVLRSEGKTYPVQDGDVINFLVNV